MFSINPTVFSTPQSIIDLLGETITYINARPYQRQPLCAIGLVIGFAHREGDLYLKVQNTTTCRERWISADDDVLGLTPDEDEYQPPSFLWNGRRFPSPYTY